jgi:hypothetical protein
MAIDAKHEATAGFKGGADLHISIAVTSGTKGVRLHYRHVDQAESYVTAEMSRNGLQFETMIPGAYTQTDFPLEYFFEVEKADGTGGLYPGFSHELVNPPYIVVRGLRS